MSEAEQPKRLTKEEQGALGLVDEDTQATIDQNERVLPMVQHFLGALGVYQFKLAGLKREGTEYTAEDEEESVKQFYVSQAVPYFIDHNIQLRDTRYLYQLLNTVASMLHSRATEQRDEKIQACFDAAQAILCALGDHDGPLYLDFTQKSNDAKRLAMLEQFITDKVIPICTDYGIELRDFDTVFAFVKAIINRTDGVIQHYLLSAKDLAEQKALGVDSIHAVGVRDIHDFLVAEPEKKE